MTSLFGQIESILFVASRPLSLMTLAKAVARPIEEVTATMMLLKEKYNQDDSGIQILWDGEVVQMATHAENGETVAGFLKQEASGELTKAQLETLTVIAYRGPITRPELEQIRGVNCAIILRLLLLRGLIEEREDTVSLLPTYTLSFAALAHLGIHSAEELADFSTLHAHEYLLATLDAGVSASPLVEEE